MVNKAAESFKWQNRYSFAKNKSKHEWHKQTKNGDREKLGLDKLRKTTVQELRE